MDFKDKAESLAEKMNKITAKFGDSLDNAEELELTGDDVIEIINEKTQNISLYEEESEKHQVCKTKKLPEVINLDNLVQDFRYVRETLKENTDNGRRILNSVTLDLLSADDEKKADLIISFAELNKALALNVKLYIGSYKEISSVILNLDKIKNAEKAIQQPNEGNTFEGQVISTVDILKQLNEESE